MASKSGTKESWKFEQIKICVTKQGILSWFHDAESYLKEGGVSVILKHPRIIYNADEIGLLSSVP